MTSYPNILLVMCDQLTARVLECYGGQAEAPNIGRISAEGVRFDNAVCPYPICSPSRASIITGKAPHEHGITHNVNKFDYPTVSSPDAEEGIRADDTTLGKVLNSAGFETHHYGKWHLTDDELPWYGDMYRENQEYAREMSDEFSRVRKLSEEEWLSWYSWSLPVDVDPEIRSIMRGWGDRYLDSPLGRFIRRMGRLEFPLEDTFDYRVGRKCVQAIENSQEPFMITSSFNYPHGPEVVPDPYYDAYKRSEIEFPGNFSSREERFESDLSHRILVELGEEVFREFLRVYYSTILLVDDQIGDILKALEEKGCLDDTIIVFTADHGDMAGGHGMIRKATDSLYDEMVNVPLLIRHGSLEPGVFRANVSLTDLMPTLLDMVGVRRVEEFPGNSMAEYLKGEYPEIGQSYSFCERLSPSPDHRRRSRIQEEGTYMVRGSRWKYLGFIDGDEYLYDLVEDPGETENLAGDPEFAGEKDHLKQRLNRWLAGAGRKN